MSDKNSDASTVWSNKYLKYFRAKATEQGSTKNSFASETEDGPEPEIVTELRRNKAPSATIEEVLNLTKIAKGILPEGSDVSQAVTTVIDKLADTRESTGGTLSVAEGEFKAMLEDMYPKK
ncbi:uncharacterized protein I206_107451 [Kwoniella pini CBS 10737]|uniref:Uncharacterized protein n=1 Tax=Kwoniella pini CBS 10737 TaxID=1296096 RepID=A0A1B9HXC3_9TREE|nr:uncharacterized protein I206_05780 [Kwoniella pini CBS 10737]OCF47916.1 hypothetical protein I206_05780 [Kwoniella pini CBS 10737]